MEEAVRVDRRMATAGVVLGFFVATAASAQNPAHARAHAHKHKPDLADAVQGTYFGDVTSDAAGSTRAGVMLIVTRVGPNRVKVVSDYSRLPEITVPLERAMDKIVQSKGDSVFLFDPDKRPRGLAVTFGDQAVWSGVARRSGGR
jgi:hypothetical protein